MRNAIRQRDCVVWRFYGRLSCVVAQRKRVIWRFVMRAQPVLCSTGGGVIAFALGRWRKA
ncbi:MAG: hypothetical protein ABNH38_00965 [Tateyamaria sp.]|uniref:hypothetical protein n=1 Tax=Tateyamaria sp. TaxID=1929288 RepID=UPI0032DC3D77